MTDAGYVVSAVTASGARFGMGSGGHAQQEHERAEGRGAADASPSRTA
jgi:hypothetical protein